MFDFERRGSLGIAVSEVNRVSVKMKEQSGRCGEGGRGRAMEPFLPSCRSQSAFQCLRGQMRLNSRLQQYLQEAFSSWRPPVTKTVGILGREMNLSCFRLRKDQQFFLFSRRTMLQNFLKDEKEKLRKKKYNKNACFRNRNNCCYFFIDDVVDIFVQLSLLFKIFMLLLFCLANSMKNFLLICLLKVLRSSLSR